MKIYLKPDQHFTPSPTHLYVLDALSELLVVVVFYYSISKYSHLRTNIMQADFK